MLLQTAPVAVYPNSSLNAPGVTITYLRQAACGCHFYGSNGSFAETVALTGGMVFSQVSGRGKRGDSFGSLECHPVRIPSSSRDHASGPFRRPAARRRSASTVSPLRGLGSSQKKFESRSKVRCTNFFRAPPRKHSLALGSRAHSLASLV